MTTPKLYFVRSSILAYLLHLLFLSSAIAAYASSHSPTLPRLPLLRRLRHLHSRHSSRRHPSTPSPEDNLPFRHTPPQTHLSKSYPNDHHNPPEYLLYPDGLPTPSAPRPSSGKPLSYSHEYSRSAAGRSSFVLPLPPPSPLSSDFDAPRSSRAPRSGDSSSFGTDSFPVTSEDRIEHRSHTTPRSQPPPPLAPPPPTSGSGKVGTPRQTEEFVGRRLHSTAVRSREFDPKESSGEEDSGARGAVPFPLPLFQLGDHHPTPPPRHSHPPTPPLPPSFSSNSDSSNAFPPPLVTTDCGDVMGLWVDVSTGGRVASFLGIPYSEPPVGDLRFRAPVPVAPWRRTREATKFGPMCIQPGNQFVWDAVRFPSPTTPTPQHQTVRPKHQRQYNQQKETKKEERNVQFPEPSILFSALIADKPPYQGSSDSDADNATSSTVFEDFPAVTLEPETPSTQQDWSADTPTAATDQGPSSPVMRRRRMRNYEMSEDCLTLNVYTPQLPSNGSTGGLPILFFIHGGSYYMNGGRLYPGEELAARGAVVVTFNYRLGPFGFLSTGEPSCRGNWGLLDQVEALRWVRRNAKVFGGDSHNSLCLVGNSAGAASVLLHMVSPVSKGLFSCAVAMSGCSGAPWALQPRPLRHAKSLASRLGCPHPNRRPHHAVACLRTFSAQLIAENSDLEDGLGVAFAPVVDGGGVVGVGGGRRGSEGSEAGTAAGGGPFIPDDPRRLMAEGRFAQVPFLSGLTRDEVSIWFNNFGPTMEKRLMRVFLDRDIRQLLNGTGLPSLNAVALSHAAAHLYLWGGRGEGLAEEGRAADGGHRASEGVSRGVDTAARGSTLAVADFISDVGLKAPCIYDMELIARSNQKPSFFYEFQYHSVDDARTDKQEWIGAYHESELQFLFGEPFLGYSNHLRAANDKEVSEMLMSLWINFAKHGHPTPDRGTNILPVDWQPFTNTHRQYLVLGYRPRMAENYLTERMVFWNYIADAFRRHPMPPFCTAPPVTAPPMVTFPLPPPNHLRWIFWTMAAGNAVFLLTIGFCIARKLRRRGRHSTNRSATPGV